MIPFNKPAVTGAEIEHIQNVFENNKFAGDGEYSKKCQHWLEKNLGASKALLTTSCTAALEMAAILIDIKEGDEVIMPSFTFVSTANAFALRGAKIVFVDIDLSSMNMSVEAAKAAVSSKTKAIVCVHYAGWSCDMEELVKVCREQNLFLIEDAAQALMCEYKGAPLGSFGDLSCFSFHETKNYQCGEGGALVINNPAFFTRAEIVREKGTNRANFLRGQTDKYTWVDLGSSYLPSELNAAFLYAQFENAELILKSRVEAWNYYYKKLGEMEEIELVRPPLDCRHNGHLFGVKANNLEERTELIQFLKDEGVMAVFHYVPLHSSPAGLKLGHFFGEDKFTTKESEKLIRLPLYYGVKKEEQDIVVNLIKKFYDKK